MLSMPALHSEVLFQDLATLLQIQLSIDLIKKAAKDGHNIWAPVTIGASRMDFLAPDFGLTQA